MHHVRTSLRSAIGVLSMTALFAVGITACGESNAGSSSSAAASGTTPTTDGPSPGPTSTPPTSGAPNTNGTTTPGPAGSAGTAVVGLATIAQPSPVGTWSKEPTVTIPSGPSPTVLQGADLIVGSGATAASGDNVTVQYVGVSEVTKETFDASWTDGQPFSFSLGQGQVIPGWDQGVVGMKVGGRRELIIPASLAYQSQSPSPKIGANATLIFVVDLLSVG